MLHRRNFLRAVLATVGGALASACREPETYVPLEEGEAYFPQSVASGDPRPDAVILWTRVDDPEAAGKSQRVLETMDRIRDRFGDGAISHGGKPKPSS